MSDFRFILIKSNGDEIIADPLPTGWADPTINLERDEDWHGLFFDYGFDLLTFTGDTAALIQTEYRARGVDGQMEIRVEFMCGDDGQYDTLYAGKIAFDSRYREVCGIECSVSVAIEDSNDVMLFRNNYEQKVNLNSNIAFDQQTELTDYEGLNFDLTIPGRGLPAKVSGSSAEQQHPYYPIITSPPGIGGNITLIRPVLNLNQVSDIETADLLGTFSYGVFPQTTPVDPNDLSPILDLNQTLNCISGVFNYTVRLKGHYREVTNRIRTVSLRATVINEVDSFPYGNTGLATTEILPITNYGSGSGPDLDFDVSFSGTCVLEQGQPFYVYLRSSCVPTLSLGEQNIYIDWDPETAVSLSTITLCDDTTSKMFMINEAVSRISEAITNDQIRFYSSIFGRLDSQPYPLTNNPCQGMFSITSGLNVRRKSLIDGSQPGFFVSMKDVFEGINPMWNIGLSIEQDPARAGFKRLRFEEYSFFYQNDIGLILNFAERIEKTIDASRIFNRVIVGYNKWEAEQTSGLNELMTMRTYRLNINTLSAEKNLTTDIIASPYTIEITRRVDTTTEDWKYDNDILAFCLRESDEPIEGAPDVQVEVFADGSVGVENIADPDTNYNGRISPIRMAMRWFNNLMQGLRQITSATKLIFTEGTGNYIAKYKLNNCDIAGSPISENDDVDITDFDDPAQAQPILFPELDTFTHPMNYNTFKRLKDEAGLMFKAVRYLCNGESREGWIKRVSYRPLSGIAEFVIIPKNNLQIQEPVPPCDAKVFGGSITAIVSEDTYGTVTFDFTEEVTGADNWQYRITNLDGAISPVIGTANAHPFVVSGLISGNYSILIIPYCGTNVGQNVATLNFVVSPALIVELSALLSNSGPDYHMVLTAVSNDPYPGGFSFKFGQCVRRFSDMVQTCAGFVGSPAPDDYATLTMPDNDSSASESSTVVTPGQGAGLITRVVIYDLVGITPAQIRKAAHQPWTLVIQ